jgi:hypothetical protein
MPSSSGGTSLLDSRRIETRSLAAADHPLGCQHSLDAAERSKAGRTFAAVLGRKVGEGRALGARPAGTTDAVNVVLAVVGEIIVDDKTDILDAGRRNREGGQRSRRGEGARARAGRPYSV